MEKFMPPTNAEKMEEEKSPTTKIGTTAINSVGNETNRLLSWFTPKNMDTRSQYPSRKGRPLNDEDSGNAAEQNTSMSNTEIEGEFQETGVTDPDYTEIDSLIKMIQTDFPNIILSHESENSKERLNSLKDTIKNSDAQIVEREQGYKARDKYLDQKEKEGELIIGRKRDQFCH